MKPSNLKAVVFDCDGVLFDTANANRKFYNLILANFGKPELTQEQFENVHMMTVKGALLYLFPEMEEDLAPVYRVMKKIDYNLLVSSMQMEEGLVTLLKQIIKNGMICAVATNRTNTMDKVLIDFDLTHMFEKVVTAKDVENPKPAPDQLFLIMKTFDLSSDQVIFIGDSQFDMDAAKAAGTYFVGFKNPALSTDLHVASMKELGILLQVDK